MYEDRWLLVCRKPAGTATEGSGAGTHDMESLLKNHLAAKGEKPQIYVIHRLDLPVEGVLVFGKDKKTAASLSQQIREHTMKKHYLAVGVSGTDAEIPEGGTVKDCIERVSGTNYSRICETGQGKPAELVYRILAEQTELDGGQEMRYLLFGIDLHTGRHHQIRIQMAHLGWPLLGDRKYGKDIAPDPGEDSPKLALCADRLEFVHPVTGEVMVFSIEPEHPVIREMRKKAHGERMCGDLQ